MNENTIEQQANHIALEIIDLIASDTEFREAMKVSPEQAMANAGFAQRVDALLDRVEGEEVSGFASIAPALHTYSRNALLGGTIVASGSPSTGCCGASSSGQLFTSGLKR